MADIQPPDCRRCQAPMERGFVLDFYTSTAESWIAGEPDNGFAVVVKTRRRPHYPIVTYRCPTCGLLESYAPAAR